MVQNCPSVLNNSTPTLSPFMHINSQEFPRVWISNTPPSNWQPAIEGLVHQGRPFVLLTRDVPGTGPEESTDQKAFAQWIKDNRNNLSKCCVASLIVVNNPILAFSLGFVVGAISKKLGFPVHVVQESDIDEKVAECLANHSQTENL